jgi:hypothetical protein
MVRYHPSEIVPVKEFPLAWRITDPRWASLPADLLIHIKPLGPSRSKQLLDDLPFQGSSQVPFDPTRFHAVKETRLDTERERSWFQSVSIPTQEEVYLVWVSAGTAAITDWGTFVQVWDDLWYPFDTLCIFDESHQWGVLLGPEERAIFVRRGPVDPRLPKTDPAYGLALFQPTNASHE